MLADVLAFLRCPHCGAALRADGPALRCPNGHSYDVARHGYAHLVPGRLTHPGDRADMVAARAELLATGVFDFISAALAAAVPAASGLVVDAGSGPGHHLAAVLDAWPDTIGLAVDTAKPAVRRAARAHPRAAAVLADTWRRLPVASGSVSVLLNVFAPRNGAEFARVLRPDGVLLVVTPTPDHLTGLVERLRLVRVDPDKPERVATSLAPWFRDTGRSTHRRVLRLNHEQVRALVAMGPSARHTDPDEIATAVAALPEPVPVTASVRLARYRPAQVDRSISSQPRGGS